MYFGYLPTELRLKIWWYAADQSRRVTISTILKKDAKPIADTNPKEYNDSEYELTIIRHIPALLFTNHESREVAQKFQSRFPVARTLVRFSYLKEPILFNLQEDLLIIDHLRTLIRLYAEPGRSPTSLSNLDPYRLNLNENMRKVLEKLHKLAYFGVRHKYAREWLGRFANLSKLGLMEPEHLDQAEGEAYKLKLEKYLAEEWMESKKWCITKSTPGLAETTWISQEDRDGVYFLGEILREEEPEPCQSDDDSVNSFFIQESPIILQDSSQEEEEVDCDDSKWEDCSWDELDQ